MRDQALWQDIIAIVLIVVVLLNVFALGYVQYASRSLLRAIGTKAIDVNVRNRATVAMEGGSRRRMAALIAMYREIVRKESSEILPGEIWARLRRYRLAVAGMYGSFLVLIAVWLGGLLLTR